MMDDEDDGLERGDEPSYYPPLLTPEWIVRMRRATQELKQAESEIFEHCAAINEGVTRIFRELP
jgi:hypothetical protein